MWTDSWQLSAIEGHANDVAYHAQRIALAVESLKHSEKFKTRAETALTNARLKLATALLTIELAQELYKKFPKSKVA